MNSNKLIQRLNYWQSIADGSEMVFQPMSSADFLSTQTVCMYLNKVHSHNWSVLPGLQQTTNRNQNSFSLLSLAYRYCILMQKFGFTRNVLFVAACIRKGREGWLYCWSLSLFCRCSYLLLRGCGSYPGLSLWTQSADSAVTFHYQYRLRFRQKLFHRKQNNSNSAEGAEEDK